MSLEGSAGWARIVAGFTAVKYRKCSVTQTEHHDEVCSILLGWIPCWLLPNLLEDKREKR